MISNKKGFTLFELFIVLAILFLLIAYAMPRYKRFIEYSLSVEAFSNISSIRNSVERCYLIQGGFGDYSKCTSFDILDIENPMEISNSAFDYEVLIPDIPQATFAIKAERNATEVPPCGGTPEVGSTVEVVYWKDKSATRSGTGVYSGIK